MTANGVNANFFDIQARALFHGHLDVPPGSLGIEAFVVDGRHYMYFPPFPALIRMPILLVTDRLDGRLTALSMLVGWVALVFALQWLFRLVRTSMRGDAPMGRFEEAGFGVLMASITGGSALVFIASQPWVYHEVYVWSAALTVATAASLIAAWTDPSLRRLLVTFGLLLATMLTRLPAGWAMSFAVIATGLWFIATRPGNGRDAPWRRAGWGLAAIGAATLLIGSTINWVKFRHPYMFPIEDHVWSRFSAHRKLVLAFNGGGIDGPQFAWTTLLAYFRPDGVRFVPFFPYVTAPLDPPRAVGDVLLDESFRTGSVTAFMPLLLGLTLWGFVATFRWWRTPSGLGGEPLGEPTPCDSAFVSSAEPAKQAKRKLDEASGRTDPLESLAALRIPLAGTIAMTGGVIAFGYVAQRYTSEFLPVLAVGAAIGFTDLARRMGGRSLAVRKGALVGIAGLAVYGLLANVAIGLMNERQKGRGRPLEQLIGLQHEIGRFTGNPLDAMVRHVDALPEHGAADELAIVGDCDALYVGNGESSGSWVPVQFRDHVFRLAVGDQGLRPGSLSLMWFSGYTLRRLHVQVGLQGQIRATLIGTPPDTSGLWLDASPGDVVVVTVHGDTAGNQFVATVAVEGRDDELVSRVDAPMTEWDQQFLGVQIIPHDALGSAADAARIGVTAEAGAGPVPGLCADLSS